MTAPLLSSGGAHWIEPAGSGVASPATVAAIIDGPGVGEKQIVATGGTSQYELIDTAGTGVYTIETAGSFPGQPRKTLIRLGDSTTIVY
jgi:hypothetical protein